MLRLVTCVATCGLLVVLSSPAACQATTPCTGQAVACAAFQDNQTDCTSQPREPVQTSPSPSPSPAPPARPSGRWQPQRLDAATASSSVRSHDDLPHVLCRACVRSMLVECASTSGADVRGDRQALPAAVRRGAVQRGPRLSVACIARAGCAA